MRVFVTGASGFIGTAVTAELIAHGHQVLGLARSDDSAAAITAAGATAHRGSVDDAASLRAGVADADAVIHLAFNHDFSKFLDNCESDRRVIGVLADALVGSARPLLITSGIGMLAPGRAALETDPPLPSAQSPRSASEEAGDEAVKRGVHVRVVRLPQVHDPHRQGLISWLIPIARETGSSAYVGDGANRWTAVAVKDAATLYRLALEKEATPGVRFHAVAEEGIPMRDIAEAIARRTGVAAESISADDATQRFGWLAHFVAGDLPASSAWTKSQLGWAPNGPSLISDLDAISDVSPLGADK